MTRDQLTVTVMDMEDGRRTDETQIFVNDPDEHDGYLDEEDKGYPDEEHEGYPDEADRGYSDSKYEEYPDEYGGESSEGEYGGYQDDVSGEPEQAGREYSDEMVFQEESGTQPSSVQSLKSQKRKLKRQQKIEKRVRHRKTLKKIRKVFLIILFLAAAGFGGAYLFLSSSVFLISDITVNHNTLKSDREIIRESGIKVGKNIFDFQNSDVKQSILKKNPYISDVDIIRKLPNRVIITVKEHTPVAAIKYQGKFLILDKNGKVAGEEKTQITATRLTGVEVQRYTKGKVPFVHNSTVLKESLKLINKVNSSGLYFKKLDMSSSFIVHAYITDDLECTGETDDIIDNLEGIKAIIYDLNQNNSMKGTIYVGRDGYATFSPDSGHKSGSSENEEDNSETDDDSSEDEKG